MKTHKDSKKSFEDNSTGVKTRVPHTKHREETTDRSFAISEQDVQNSQDHAIEELGSVSESATDQNLARDRSVTR